MAVRNNTPERGIDGALDTPRVIYELWERCCDNLSDRELEWFAGAGEYAEHVAFQLEQVVDGVGCMVSNDTSENGGTPTGYFTPEHSLPALLFSISQSISHIRALINIADSASDRLIHPERYQREEKKGVNHG